MSFSFGDSQKPIDLSKGGDKGSGVTRPPLPTPPAGIKQPPVVNDPNGGNAPLRNLPSMPQVNRPPVAPQQAPHRVPQPAPQQTQYEQQPTPQQAPQQQPQEYATPSYQPPIVPVQNNPAPYQQQAPQFGGQPSFGSNQPQQQVTVEPQVVKVDRRGRPFKEKIQKNQKEQKKGKTKGKGAFAGDRKKVFWARILVFGLTGILVLTGLGSFLPKTSGLTSSDGPLILNKVREDLGITAFPTTAGEGWALGFTTSYLNYDPSKREQRFKDLLNYAPENIIKAIDIRPTNEKDTQTSPTSSDDENYDPATTPEDGTVDTSDQKPDTTTNTGTETTGTDTETNPDGTTPPVETPEKTETPTTPTTAMQTVTDGPYLVRTVMIAGGTDAIFTVRAQVNGSKWLYLEIPIKYNPETKGLSISGSPTFVQPINPFVINIEESYGTSWANDKAIVDNIKDDIKGYLKAWGASDLPTIQRYTLKEGGNNVATTEAVTGLNGQVVYVSAQDLTVESKPLSKDASASEKADYNTRKARVTVTWLEPSSGIVYKQIYELTLQYANNDWFVKDIKNIATSAGQYKDRL